MIKTSLTCVSVHVSVYMKFLKSCKYTCLYTRLRLAQGAEHSAARRNRQEKRQIVLISSNTGIDKFFGWSSVEGMHGSLEI